MIIYRCFETGDLIAESCGQELGRIIALDQQMLEPVLPWLIWKRQMLAKAAAQ